MRDYHCRRNADDRLYTADEIIARADGGDAILCCPTDAFTAELISALPTSIKIIASFSVGVDHINIGAAKSRGIVCTNTPDVLSDATAEVAILCMLGAARRATEWIELLRENRWRNWSPTQLLGSGLAGKRLGIIGMGGVGRATATRARAFGMAIHYHNRNRLAARDEGDATYHASVESLLKVSDVLSLHCPATSESANLITAERIALLPDGAIVINTARGALLDDDAVIAALKSGKLRAVGLDVYAGEPDQIHPEYRHLANAFLLPHIGSATTETRTAMGNRALQNLDAYFAGKPPGDCVV